jgi:plasmid replication initiation protein
MGQNKLIRQDNSITNARYDFTACQLDILFCVMSQIHDEHGSNIYSISAKEIEILTSRKWNYKQFDEATDSLGSRKFEIDTNRVYRKYWLFQRVDYIKGEGKIEIKFSDEGIALLKNLKNNFTTYELKSALSMSSKYAKRIYQLCSQWKDIGETKKYDIKEFKAILGLFDSKGNEPYKSISALKKYVFDIAVRQINEHSDLKVSYHMEGERGRKRPLKYVTFYIKKRSIVSLPLKFQGELNLDIRQQNLLLILDELGIKSLKIIDQIKESEVMTKIVFEYNYGLKTGTITAKNPAGLLIKKLGLS